MTNEPIDFDPAFRDIAAEVKKVVGRLRARFGAREWVADTPLAD